MFRGTPRAQVAAITAQARVLRAPRGSTLMRANQPLPGLLVVVRGALKLVLNANGGERVLGLLGPGDSYGEANVVLGTAPRVHVAALVESTAAMLPREALLALTARDARFALRLAGTLAEQVLALIDMEANVPRHGARRLASYLDSLAPRPRAGGACSVQLPASKTVIASLLGMKKETLSRLLRELADRGLIQVAQRNIAILNRAALAELAG